MAIYRKIDCRISNDKKFRSLSLEARYAWFFILTKRELAPLGAFSSSLEALAIEQGTVQYLSEKESLTGSLSESLSLDMVEVFRKAYLELVKEGLILYDKTEHLIYIPNFLKYNLPESPNVIKSWNSAIDSLPECELRDFIFAKSAEFIINNQSDSFKKALPKEFVKAYNEGYEKALPKAFKEDLPKAFPKAMPNQEQEQYIYKEEIKKVEKKKEEKPENENQNFLFEEQNETAENENSSKPKKEKKKAITFPMPYTEIPQHWVEMCHELTPDIDPFQAFTEFKLYWTVGKGAGKVTSERGWNQSWMNWLKIEAKKMTAPRYQHSGPIPPMPQRKYDQNGTLITTNKNGVRDSGFADPDYYKIKPKGY